MFEVERARRVVPGQGPVAFSQVGRKGNRMLRVLLRTGEHLRDALVGAVLGGVPVDDERASGVGQREIGILIESSCELTDYGLSLLFVLLPVIVTCGT